MSGELSEIKVFSEAIVRYLKGTAGPDTTNPRKKVNLPDERTLEVCVMSQGDMNVLEILLLPRNPDQIGYSTGQFIPGGPAWESTGGLYNFAIYDEIGRASCRERV